MNSLEDGANFVDDVDGQLMSSPASAEGGQQRAVVAFLGGLDITDGRYDSLDFPLWSTLQTLHRGDFYQNCVREATEDVGPRQPWHDCHAKVEGAAALDIKRNFEER